MLLVRFPSNFSSISISFFIFSAPNGAVDPDPERLFTDPDPAVIFFSQKKKSPDPVKVLDLCGSGVLAIIIL